MLTNAYLLAKIGADTAENEQHFAENVGKIGRAQLGVGYGIEPRLGELLVAMAVSLAAPPLSTLIKALCGLFYFGYWLPCLTPRRRQV